MFLRLKMLKLHNPVCGQFGRLKGFLWKCKDCKKKWKWTDCKRWEQRLMMSILPPRYFHSTQFKTFFGHFSFGAKTPTDIFPPHIIEATFLGIFVLVRNCRHHLSPSIPRKWGIFLDLWNCGKSRDWICQVSAQASSADKWKEFSVYGLLFSENTNMSSN